MTILTNIIGHTEAVHKKTREELREKYGKEALAVLNKDKVSELLKTKNIIVIDGMCALGRSTYI